MNSVIYTGSHLLLRQWHLGSSDWLCLWLG